MTREEAKEWLDTIIARYEVEDEWVTLCDRRHYIAIRMAIKALGQEPKFIAKSDGTIEQIKNCDDCLFKKEWEKIGKSQSKTGYWINVNEGKWNTIPAYKCSACGANADLRDWSGESPFCPWCGARMESEGEK